MTLVTGLARSCLAGAELLGYRQGTEWMVGHSRFARP